jgi:hypothetical protein
MGIAHHVSIAPPVKITSVIFIDNSMPIIEIKLIPKAVFIALLKFICFSKINVSKIMEVISPFNIAKDITNEILNVCSID